MVRGIQGEPRTRSAVRTPAGLRTKVHTMRRAGQYASCPTPSHHQPPYSHSFFCTARQRFQHLYLGALYGVLAMKSVFVDDFATLAGGRIGPVAVARMTRAEAALFWAGKAAFFSAFLGAPALAGAHSWAALAALWLGSEAVAGWVLALMFQVGTPCRYLQDGALHWAGKVLFVSVVLSALAAAGAHFGAAPAALWLASQHFMRWALALTVRSVKVGLPL